MIVRASSPQLFISHQSLKPRTLYTIQYFSFKLHPLLPSYNTKSREIIRQVYLIQTLNPVLERKFIAAVAAVIDLNSLRSLRLELREDAQGTFKAFTP
jgi:hypothetical protein